MKKLISVILVVSMLVLTASALVLANVIEDDDDFVGFEWGVASPYFLQVTGTVVSVDEFDPDNEFTQDWLMVGIEDEDGNPANIVITERTFFPFESSIEVGDVVTGYYLADWPMIMIYPPQYTATVLVNGMPDDLRVHIDRFFETDEFDYDFLSRSEMFAFNVGENTEIVMADPEMDFFEYNTVEDLAGRRLVIIYGASTRGIPEAPIQDGQPYKIVVLFEDAIPLGPPMFDLNDDFGFDLDVPNMPILVNDVEIDALPAFMHENGFSIMLPLRAVAEALGFEVRWDNESWAVILDDEIKLYIDGDYYLLENGVATAVEFGPSPMLVDGSTFVPMLFFTHVADMANAFAFEGRIEIHSEGERME